jgi:hypothetical protein
VFLESTWNVLCGSCKTRVQITQITLYTILHTYFVYFPRGLNPNPFMDFPQLKWKEDLHIPSHLRLYMQNERIVSFNLWWWYWKYVTYTQGHNLQNIYIIQVNIKNHEDAMNMKWNTYKKIKLYLLFSSNPKCP